MRQLFPIRSPAEKGGGAPLASQSSPPNNNFAPIPEHYFQDLSDVSPIVLLVRTVERNFRKSGPGLLNVVCLAKQRGAQLTGAAHVDSENRGINPNLEMSANPKTAVLLNYE